MAILRLYARKYDAPFDFLSWITTLLDKSKSDSINYQPDEGIYIEGLAIECAKWDESSMTLVECSPTDLVSYLFVMNVAPTQQKNYYNMINTYECPVIRTQNRGSSALSLPNYIISFFIPTPHVNPGHWVQKSVAAFITTQ